MRILILSSSTGGGHDMRARSFCQWIKDVRCVEKNIEVDRYQPLESISPIYKFGVSIYNGIQKHCPGLHHIYFNWLELFQVSANERFLLGKQAFINQLEEKRPDVIISVHAHVNHAFRKVAKRILPEVRFVVYCGEMYGGYGFSKHWVDLHADLFIGATPDICKAAEELGMDTERIVYGGFMLHPNFYSPRLDEHQKNAFRKTSLGLAPNVFTLLLSTGANGAQNHIAFLNTLEEAQLKIQVVALAGKNPKNLEILEQWAANARYVRLSPKGYVDNMFPLIQACDLLVARPGTGTTSEAIQANCPVLFNAVGGIMPQEWITVKYLRANGLAAPVIKKAKQLLQYLNPIISDPANALVSDRDALARLIPEPKPWQIIETIHSKFQKTKQRKQQTPKECEK